MNVRVMTDYSSEQPDVQCNKCGKATEVKTSQSAKNPNRDYWRCTDRACGSFVGWVDGKGNGGASSYKRARSDNGDDSRLAALEQRVAALETLLAQ